MSKYYLSVGAMFKNESHSIQEWITHYLHHGVDHFYLINDKSTDNSVERIQPYIDKGLITLFHVEEPYYLGRQRNLYNRHILPLLKESQWLLMIDLDEYVWSPRSSSLPHILRHSEHLGQIQLKETIFGSNGHIKQPAAIIPSFTKREPLNTTRSKKIKYFVNSNYEFTSLNIHHADFTKSEYMQTNCIISDGAYFQLNHYNCQSLEFWTQVKCSRGDADNYLVRVESGHSEYDMNDEEDLGLYNQNKELYEMTLKI